MKKKSESEGLFDGPGEFRIISNVQSRFKVYVVPINLINDWSN